MHADVCRRAAAVFLAPPLAVCRRLRGYCMRIRARVCARACGRERSDVHTHANATNIAGARAQTHTHTPRQNYTAVRLVKYSERAHTKTRSAMFRDVRRRVSVCVF